MQKKFENWVFYVLGVHFEFDIIFLSGRPLEVSRNSEIFLDFFINFFELKKYFRIFFGKQVQDLVRFKKKRLK